MYVYGRGGHGGDCGLGGGGGPRLPAASMAAGEGYTVTDAAAVSKDMMQSPDQLVAEAEANSLDLGG